MMTFGPKRGHILYIFDSFFKDFGLLLVAIVVGIAQGNLMEALSSNLGIAVIVVIMPIFRITDYLTTRITVTPEKIAVTSGFLVKSNSEIPAASITTIDYSQNLIQQLFKVYRIKIENSSNMSVENENSKIRMVFGMDDINEIKAILGNVDAAIDGANIAPEMDEATGRNRKIRIPAGKIVLMGLLKSKGTLIVEGFALVCALAGYLSESLMEDIGSMFMTLTVIGMVVALIVFLAAIFVLEIIISVIRYINFTITDRGDTLLVEYGLFTKKQYTLVKSRISGFSYEQSFLMRRMHVGTLNVFAVGFGNDDERNSTSMLHPLISEHAVREFIGEFTEHFSVPCEMEKAAEGSLRYFFYRPVFIITLILLAAGIVASFVLELWWPAAAAAALFILAAAGRVMEYGNTMAGGNEKEIVLVSGGFKKVWTYIRTDNAESVSSSGSIWKRRKDIVDLKVDFLGLESISTGMAYNMNMEMEDRIRGLLIF